MYAKTLILAMTAAVATLANAKSETPMAKMSALVRQMAKTTSTAWKSIGAKGEPRTTVFVCIDGGDSILTANHCTVYDRRDDIYIVSLPIGRLRPLAESKAVRRIEASRPCATTMDTTTTIINALPVYAGEALPQAYTGKGTVVGVMDVGFDFTHPNFIDPTTGLCRVKAFWDQMTSDTIGSTFPVGRDYTTAETIASIGHSADALIETHGTHTMGCAAGGGYNSPYRGMAYESELCAVGNAVSSNAGLLDPDDLYKYTSATDALGFKYIFDYADSVGLPCVASLSEGYTVGDDSEDSLFCAYIDKLVGAGHIIVASAGNSSQRPSYVGKPAGKERAGAGMVAYGNESYIFVNADNKFCLDFIAFDGTKAIDTLKIESDCCMNNTDTTFQMTLPTKENLFTANVTRYPSALVPGDTVFCMIIESDHLIYTPYDVVVAVEGTEANVAMRCGGEMFFGSDNGDGTWNDAEISHNVNAPACFKNVIAVGSTIHRTGFTNYLGTYYDYSQAGRNDGVRSNYSSIGPGTGGVTKPDIMAPGDNIVSSYSSFYIENNPEASDVKSDVAHFEYNGRTYAWNSNTGTSMAAPVVAGAIALWLQAKPTLTPDEVKDILSRTARQPEAEMVYPNNYYGHGEIDVYRGLLCALGIDGIKAISTKHLSGVRVGLLSNGQLSLNFATAPSSAFKVSVYSVNGKCVLSETVRPTGGSSFSLPLTDVANGVYAVQVTSSEQSCTGSTLVRF